jgi:hypothetical protein
VYAGAVPDSVQATEHLSTLTVRPFESVVSALLGEADVWSVTEPSGSLEALVRSTAR